jgi:hypothetical protein
MTERERKLREEYFDGPASDSMSLMQFFLSKGFDPRKEKKKMSKGGIVPRYKDGGLVPKSLKGFSKLPEAVQKKIDPKLAKKV